MHKNLVHRDHIVKGGERIDTKSSKNVCGENRERCDEGISVGKLQTVLCLKKFGGKKTHLNANNFCGRTPKRDNISLKYKQLGNILMHCVVAKMK